MRILVATEQWFPDFRGGAGRVATETAFHLAERGHAVTVLAARQASRPTRVVERDVEILRVVRRSALPQTFTDPLEVARHAWLLGRRFDVGLAHQPTVFAGLAAGSAGIPLALVYHASAPRELRLLRPRLPLGRQRAAKRALEPALRAFERFAVRRADRLLVLSEFSRKLLAGDHPGTSDRVRLVGGGVDTAAFAPGDGPDAARVRLGIEPNGPLLFTARRFEPRMGLEELVWALERVSGPRLVVAGTGMLFPRIEALIAQHGLQNRVRLLGAVSDEELRDWYRAADLFVLPTVAYEGFGLVTAEALACGTPVLGTSVGATPELLMPVDPRLVCERADPASLAAGIQRALDLTGPELRNQCRRHAERELTWLRTIVRWEDAIGEVVGTRVRGEPVVAAR